MIRKINTPMNIGACVGLPETIAGNLRKGINSEHDLLNAYAGKDFYEDENFRAALERMNDGYEIATNLIQMMEDYCEIDRIRAQNLLSFSQKWMKTLKNQSTISSYHTTKRAQLDTVRSAKHLARVDENRCDALQTIITQYRQIVNETYIRVNFGHRYEHRRMREFKKLFKHAHATLTESKKNLDKIRAQQKRAKHALLEANNTLEVNNDQTMSEKKRINNVHIQSKCEIELKILEEKVTRAKKDYADAKRIYRKKARDIFLQCQEVEKERLEQIREILLGFIQTMHTRNYTSQIEQIYDQLISNITTQQNSLSDLIFWANTYGIIDDETVSISSTNIQPRTTTSGVNDEPRIEEEESEIDEDEDELSVTTTTATTTTNRKQKQVKTSTISNKKATTSDVELTTPNGNVPDSV